MHTDRFLTFSLYPFWIRRIQSKNEEIHDGNLDLIVKYLQDIEKERKKSKPKDIKLPNLKKISSSDSYKITSLGKNFLELITE